MVVGNGSISVADVERNAIDADKLIAYAESLVPKEFRGSTVILDNQKYLCCLLLRRSKIISWDKKKEIIEYILKNIRLTGFTDCVVEVSEIMDYANINKIQEYRRRLP